MDNVRIFNIYQAAEEVGLAPSSLRRYCIRHNIGQKLHRRGWWFTEDDIRAIKSRPDGRSKWQQRGGGRRIA